MQISLKWMRIVIFVALGCLLFLPALGSADVCEESGNHCESLGTVVFGPGVHEPVTIPLGGQFGLMSMQSDSSTLKSLIISVQNGTQRGKDKASSAVINVNGKDIFTQKNFNQNVSPSSLTSTIDVAGSGMQQVVLTTRVNGRKDVRLSVTITAVYEEQEMPVQWCLDTDVPPNGIGGPITGWGTATTPPPDDPRGIWFPACGDFQ